MESSHNASGFFESNPSQLPIYIASASFLKVLFRPSGFPQHRRSPARCPQGVTATWLPASSSHVTSCNMLPFQLMEAKRERNGRSESDFTHLPLSHQSESVWRPLSLSDSTMRSASLVLPLGERCKFSHIALTTLSSIGPATSE